MIEGVLYGSSPLRTAVGSVDAAELLRLIRDRLEEEPRTRAELVKAIAERWPDADASALGYAMYLLPTVQVTPRGVWGQTGRSAFTTVESWLGRPIEPDTQPDEMLLRYLAAYGPSTVADAQTWSGLSGLGERSSASPPPAKVPGRATPRALRRPERCLAEGRHTGAAAIPPRVRQRPARAQGPQPRLAAQRRPTWTEVGWGTVLVDGFVAARWKLDREDEERRSGSSRS